MWKSEFARFLQLPTCNQLFCERLSVIRLERMLYLQEYNLLKLFSLLRCTGVLRFTGCLFSTISLIFLFLAFLLWLLSSLIFLVVKMNFKLSLVLFAFFGFDFPLQNNFMKAFYWKLVLKIYLFLSLRAAEVSSSPSLAFLIAWSILLISSLLNFPRKAFLNITDFCSFRILFSKS